MSSTPLPHSDTTLGITLEPPSSEAIGLIAGWGRFPVIIAEKAKARGIPIVCVGIRGMADDKALRPLVTHFAWMRAAALNRPVKIFRKYGVRRWTMAGKFYKHRLLSPFRWITLLPDWRTLRFWYRRVRANNSDDSLLLAVIAESESVGLECISALDITPELLVREGLLTKLAPTPAQEADIAYGWYLAKEMGRLDVGQSVTVKDRAVLAVEAIEGTDRAIRRTAEYCKGGGFTVVKLAKPQQDRRFDVPTIGPQTIQTMKDVGAKVLAIEAGQTIIIDEQATIDLANRYGIVIVSRTDAQMQQAIAQHARPGGQEQS